MKNPEGTKPEPLVQITQADAARAYAQATGLADSQDPWETWTNLPEETRDQIVTACRAHLLRKVNLTAIWEQAMLSEQFMTTARRETGHQASQAGGG